MEIESDHIVQLIAGQATTAQAVRDLKDSVEKGFKFIHGEHQELEKTVGKVAARVGKVEKKVWYATSVGAALGYAASYFGFHIGK